MNARIEKREDGDHLILDILLNPTPQLSQSGRAYVVAESGGRNRWETTNAVYQGKEIGVNLIATIRK